MQDLPSPIDNSENGDGEIIRLFACSKSIHNAVRPGEGQMPVSIVTITTDRQASMDDEAGAIAKLEVIWTSASKRAAGTIIGLSNGKLDMAHCPTRIR